MRSPSLLGALVVAAAAAASLSMSAPAQADTKYTECQHPVVTGVEVSNLRHVSTATACPVALSLYSWENKDANGTKLYKCTSSPPGVVLKLHKFDGWKLSITKSGFEMSRGQSSFYVSGTDFPIACN
ncbi:MAG: hypothetical protein ABSG64_01035 [Solirubrobacteraceae bacterium]|jgi:hypothetical protein